MKHVFVRVAEGANLDEGCILLSGDDAKKFIDDKDAWLETYNREAYIVSSREFSPDNLVNATTGSPDSIGRVFTALLALDGIDHPMVSDLFATLFEMGHEEGESYAGYKTLPDYHENAYGRARRRRMMFEGP